MDQLTLSASKLVSALVLLLACVAAHFGAVSAQYGNSAAAGTGPADGQNFTEEQAEEIGLNWIERWCDLCTQFSNSCDVVRSQGGENVPLPPGPLKVLPETTYLCITRDYCHHREYMTSDISQTKSVLGFRIPQQMMQVFSLRLSSCKSKSYPISIYGIFAPLPSEDCILDMDYMFLAEGVDAVIQVLAVVDSPHHARFFASSSCFDKEIVIFEGNCVKKGELFTHTVAVIAEENLSVRLGWENSVLEWTFKDGELGAISYPDDNFIPFYVNRRKRNAWHRVSALPQTQAPLVVVALLP
ncbi:hypothetical protein C2845_PM18G00160 [Panicum miliaceum]|uniref:Uncharacterized protein n=1 Tax=Panicum miliaceum TaxID=4540 RepID=A0A3L6PKN7_PANMI|nr:hypothetical protein C2845_PM18G00160 [Panicum miliaceum]